MRRAENMNFWGEKEFIYIYRFIRKIIIINNYKVSS